MPLIAFLHGYLNLVFEQIKLFDFLKKISSCSIKARSDDPILLVPKIGSCEHIENDLPTHWDE